jgi:DNA repair protein RadC
MNEQVSQFWEDLKSGRFASMVKESSKGKCLSNSQEVYNVLKPMFKEQEDVEQFYIIFLDTKNKIIAIEKVFSGTIAASAIYCREIIKRLIGLQASAFVVSHNHPSGDTNPSLEDRSITIKIGIAAASIDVSFHDHIIIGDGYYSMADSGFMKTVSTQFKKMLAEG